LWERYILPTLHLGHFINTRTSQMRTRTLATLHLRHFFNTRTLATLHLADVTFGTFFQHKSIGDVTFGTFFQHKNISDEKKNIEHSPLRLWLWLRLTLWTKRTTWTKIYGTNNQLFQICLLIVFQNLCSDVRAAMH